VIGCSRTARAKKRSPLSLPDTRALISRRLLTHNDWDHLANKAYTRALRAFCDAPCKFICRGTDFLRPRADAGIIGGQTDKSHVSTHSSWLLASVESRPLPRWYSRRPVPFAEMGVFHGRPLSLPPGAEVTFILAPVTEGRFRVAGVPW